MVHSVFPTSPNGPPRQPDIVAAVRQRILNGDYPAGGQLPTVRELGQEFYASLPTIHRSLKTLGDHGFISTHGRRGTRVVDYPPHRHCFGLIMGELPDEQGIYHNRHWQALAMAATELANDPIYRIELFHGIDGHPQLPEHQRLLAALSDQRLAGIIVADPVRIHPWCDLTAINLPVIGFSPVPERPDLGIIDLGTSTFIQRAIEVIAERGLRHIALILPAGSSCIGLAAAFIRGLQAHGLEAPAYWIHTAPLDAPAWAAHCVASLFHPDHVRVPEALIIADDNVLPDVERGLREQTRSHPFLVCMANVPQLEPLSPQVMHLGWDQREYLHCAMARLCAYHQRQEPVGWSMLPVRMLNL